MKTILDIGKSCCCCLQSLHPVCLFAVLVVVVGVVSLSICVLGSKSLEDLFSSVNRGKKKEPNILLLKLKIGDLVSFGERILG